MSAASSVAIGGVVTTHVVPRCGLVAAPRGEPRGPGDQDSPARLRDAQHLTRHLLGVRHVLKDVAGVGQVEAGVGKRQAQSRGADGVSTRLAPGGQLTDVGVDTRIGRASCAKGIREVARTATDIQDHGAAEIAPPRSLTDRVSREQGVEPVGIALLDAEGAEQGDGAAQGSDRGEQPGCRRRLVQYLPRLAHFRTLTRLPFPNNQSTHVLGARVRIAILNWRDLTHPDAGGAERYAVNVATGLVRRGHEVTLMCADHGAAPRDETVDGVRLRRRGGRVGVYPQALRGVRWLERTESPFDVVVDVQNGLPFFAPLATRTPVVSLVHHVHREQWPVVFGPLAARIGWGIESRLSPRVYRGRQYVAVSGRTKDELAQLGVDPSHIAVIHNGTDQPMSTGVPRSPHPTIVVLGRLVPHKRVEHAIEVLAKLRESHPDLRLRIIGDGWWAPNVRAHAKACRVT